MDTFEAVYGFGVHALASLPISASEQRGMLSHGETGGAERPGFSPYCVNGLFASRRRYQRGFLLTD